MELKREFDDFLSNIRLTENQIQDLKTGHSTLTKRLSEYEGLKHLIINIFLQGSYKRHTAIRPNNDRRADVDIVVVTNLHEDQYTPKEAFELFTPFMEDYYKNKWKLQNRSIGIEMSYVDLDLVITSAPSEAHINILKSDAVSSYLDIVEAFDWRLNESWIDLDKRYEMVSNEILKESQSQPEWKSVPLRIPDMSQNTWQDTDPLSQMKWTKNKNENTNKHFVNVVKAIKWWRLEKHPTTARPKGYPLERIVGECCPDGITSVAEGVVLSLENIVSNYKHLYLAELKPRLPDYGVQSHDVFAKITNEEFRTFYRQVKRGAELARQAFDCKDYDESCNVWGLLFGSKFPKPPEKSSKGFTTPEKPATPVSERFA